MKCQDFFLSLLVIDDQDHTILVNMHILLIANLLNLLSLLPEGKFWIEGDFNFFKFRFFGNDIENLRVSTFDVFFGKKARWREFLEFVIYFITIAKIAVCSRSLYFPRC